MVQCGTAKGLDFFWGAGSNKREDRGMYHDSCGRGEGVDGKPHLLDLMISYW